MSSAPFSVPATEEVRRMDSHQPGPVRRLARLTKSVLAELIYIAKYQEVLRLRRRTQVDTKAMFSVPSATFAEIPDFDTYVHHDPGIHKYVLLDGRMTWAPAAAPMRIFLPHLRDTVLRYVEDASTGTVVEFGCGNGHNILYLAKQFPGMRCFGIDQAEPRIATARLAAKQFGLTNVEFIAGDATRPQPGLPEQADVCYSVAALEQMPRIYAGAVESMVKRARRAVVLFEPIPEMWTLNWRGLMARFRALMVDNMHGMPDFLRAHGYRVTEMSLLDYADDPYNPISEIHIVPTGTASVHR